MEVKLLEVKLLEEVADLHRTSRGATRGDRAAQGGPGRPNIKPNTKPSGPVFASPASSARQKGCANKSIACRDCGL
jgi:hypothetical protein